MKFVSLITIQSWGTGHRVTTEKEIENDRYRNEGGPVQSGTKQSESPNACDLSMARLNTLTLGPVYDCYTADNETRVLPFPV